MLQEKQYHFFISLNPNTTIFNSPQKNLLNSFYRRTFVSKYHLYYISTDMENTTHKEETHKTPFARMRQRLKERKHRVMRLIELKRLRRIRKRPYPGTPTAKLRYQAGGHVLPLLRTIRPRYLPAFLEIPETIH